MKSRIADLALLASLPLLAGLLLPPAARAQYETYLWQFPSVTNISPAADSMKTVLREEVQSILDAGRLRPLRTFNGDVFAAAGYFLYWERGRLLATFGWAWPHLTPAQQSAVTSYVHAELSDPLYLPWSTSPRHVPPTAGARREPYPMSSNWTWDNFWNQDGDTRPVLHVLYGLWLYAHRSGDWSVVADNWTAIKSFYSANQAEGDHYGTMGAHVAMARMAERQNDAAMQTQAISNANQWFAAGLDFAAQEARVEADYGSVYETRRASQLYPGFMFLNLSPEVGRYLKNLVSAPVLARNAWGRERYPGWYLLNSSYFSYWTGGDEGNGIPIEIMGMIAPVERWVAETPAAQLAAWMRSCPAGRGDCYWLEALVQAIEAYGALNWVDVRGGAAVETPPGIAATGLTLESIRPNPATASVRIRLRVDGQGRPVTFRIFDPAGREVAHRSSPRAVQGPFEFHWPGDDDAGRPLPSGVYLCRIDAGDETRRARLVLAR